MLLLDTTVLYYKHTESLLAFFLYLQSVPFSPAARLPSDL